MKFLDKNGVELKAGMLVISELDKKPSLIVDIIPDENSKCKLGIDATNYKYYENYHNRELIAGLESNKKLFGEYKPKVEQVYPLTEFSLKTAGDREGYFILADFEICDKPENFVMPEGAILTNNN